MALAPVSPPARRPSGDACPYEECDGSGFRVDEEARAAVPCRCRPERVARVRARALRRTLPSRYRGVSFDRPPVSDMVHTQPDALREVRRHCEEIGLRLDAGRGLWLLGEAGTGKTTLAMLIARHAMELHRTTAIYSTVRLLEEIRATFDRDAEHSAYELIDRLIEVDLLILDDLAVVRPTDWVLEQLYSIVNGRYEEERSIVFTCDLTGVPRGGGEEEPAGGPPRRALPDPRRLAEHVGYRTYSRLVEVCGDPVVLFGPDRRIAR